MAENVKVYNPNDGLTGRDGGPYLDIEEAKEREIRSARMENREPDFSGSARGIGIPEKTARDILDRRYFPPSQKDAPEEVIEEHLSDGNLGEVTFEPAGSEDEGNFDTTHAEEYGAPDKYPNAGSEAQDNSDTGNSDSGTTDDLDDLLGDTK